MKCNELGRALCIRKYAKRRRSGWVGQGREGRGCRGEWHLNLWVARCVSSWRQVRKMQPVYKRNWKIAITEGWQEKEREGRSKRGGRGAGGGRKLKYNSNWNTNTTANTVTFLANRDSTKISSLQMQSAKKIMRRICKLKLQQQNVNCNNCTNCYCNYIAVITMTNVGQMLWIIRYDTSRTAAKTTTTATCEIFHWVPSVSLPPLAELVGLWQSSLIIILFNLHISLLMVSLRILR